MAKKYYIKTFGCQMNHSDSERIATVLENGDLKATLNINKADFVVFNTCGVRQMAEDRVYGQIHNLKTKKPKIKIILTGCLANRKDVQRRLKGKVDLFFPINNFKTFEDWIIGNCLEIGNCKLKILARDQSISKENIAYLSIRPKHESTFSAYVPIMTGCNNLCAYCVVPYARGREISRPAEEIVREVKNLVGKGYKEIVLLGQNVNSYRFIDTNSSAVASAKEDKIITFSQLLKKINSIPGHFWISFISNHPKDVTDEMIEAVAKLPKVSECFHLPVQSGNNEVIRKMNRKYTAKQYLNLVKKIKSAYKKYKPKKLFSITSDIIVGFPGETKKQLLDSAEVMKKAKFDMVFFGQYSPRPGTAAWKMKDNVSKREKIWREKYLNEILKKTTFANNKKYVGKTMEVLIDSKKGDFYYGKTRTMKNVKFASGGKNLVGKFVKIRITKENIWNLEGAICHPTGGRPVGREFGRYSDKIIVILGPTSSGKSSVAIKLAKKFNGEIISADSRQIYRSLDLGTGKVTKTEQKMVPHWLIDVASPKIDFNVTQFKRRAEKIIADILKRKKMPIICGGTGFWIKSVVDDVSFPKVKPNKVLRNMLSNKSESELFTLLMKLDPERSRNIDPKNKIRLIRAIEICESLGHVPKNTGSGLQVTGYRFLQIGIDVPRETLNEKIKKRLKKRFRAGLVEEVRTLRKNGLSWKKIQSFGLAYFWIPLYLEKKISLDELHERVYLAEKDYAKRQMTWFRKDKRIVWLKSYKEIEREAKKLLN